MSNNPDGKNQHTNADLYNSLTMRKAKAIAMLDAGSTYTEVMSLTGLSRQTVANCSKGKYNIPAPMLIALRESEEEKLTLLHHKIMDSMLTDENSMHKATLNQKMVAAAIALDKRELLAGRPTKRLELSRGDDALLEEIEKLRVITGDAIEAEYKEADGQSSEEQSSDSKFTNAPSTLDEFRGGFSDKKGDS